MANKNEKSKPKVKADRPNIQTINLPRQLNDKLKQFMKANECKSAAKAIELLLSD